MILPGHRRRYLSLLALFEPTKHAKTGFSTCDCGTKYDCATTVPCSSSRCMEWVPKALGLITQGIHSNWWGIACPAHCFGSGLASLAAAFCLGLLLGLILGAILIAWFLEFLPRLPSTTASAAGHPSARVRAYLHEPEAISRALRRRRD